MNPVNPGVTVDLSNGAAAIPDQETFETLAYRSPSGMFYVKYIVLGIETDRPSVYFMNTNKFQRHPDFLRAIRVDSQGDFRSTIIYDPEFVAPDGSLGVFRFSNFRLPKSFSFMERTYTLLAGSMPLVKDNLALWIHNQVLPTVQDDIPLYGESRINVVFDEDVFGDTEFMALNPGEGFGLLRNMDPDERPNSRDIVIYETLPNELPRVAGIISTVPQTPLSHVNLRALQDSIPNAFIAGALEDDTVSGLIDSYVHYAVTETGYTIRSATQEEVDGHYASSRPAEVQTPQRDLTVTSITALSEIGFDDWDSFGVKAANVAVLGTLDFPEGTVPNGFAAPFYFYDEFMKHNGLYDDVREMLADSDFQTDYDTKADKLKDLRKKIKKAETPEWIETELTEMHATFPEGTSLRYRSSTNNEDLPGFNGAGLYDSKTQHPDETEEDGISKSLKQVYASLWNFRAFIERDFHRIDHLAAAMGVLVHPNYSDELVNGVAVSVDPAYGTEGTYYVNSQVGEDLVTNPEAHSVPEETLLYPDGTYTVAALSNQVPQGQLLMTDDQLAQLRRRLDAVHDKFAELYAIEGNERFAMEVEFKITSVDVLAIKQARPWIFADPPPEIDVPDPEDTGVALTGSFYNIPATHGGNPFSVRVRFSENISTRQPHFRDHAVAVTGGRVTDARRTSACRLPSDCWEIEITPDSGADVTIVLSHNRPCRVSGAICIQNGRRLSNRLELTVRDLPVELLPATPDPPTGTALWAGIVDLQWNDVPRAESYEVQFINIDQQQWWWTHLPAYGIEIAIYGPGAIIRGLSHNGPYHLRVRAVNSVGVSEWSDYVVLPKTGGAGAWAGVSEPSNSAATGTPTIIGTPITPGKLTADISGIADENGLDRVKFNYQWIRSDGTDATDIEGATNISYRLTAEDIGKAVRVRVSFVDRHGFEESLTSAATAAVTPDTRPPLTAEFRNTPSSHDGQNAIIFELRFSEEPVPRFSYRTLQDHAFTVTGGEVTRVRRLGETGNMRWEISVRPDGDGGVNIVLPATEDCDVEGAICNGDARTLSSTLEVTIRGPHEPNSPATGAPTITGTVRVGETLTVDTLGITDENGLDNATYTYRWTANDGTSDTDIQDATGSTYTLVSDDEGKAVKVKVNFTDDEGNEETLTSAATSAVAARPNSPATGLPAITGTVQVGETLTADVSGIGDADGLDNVSFSYQWIRSDGTTDTDITGATGSTYTLADGDEGKAIKVRVSFTDDAGNEESLTSAPVALDRPYGLTAAVSDGAVVLTWKPPVGQSYMFDYQILRNRPELGEAEPLVYVTYTETEETTYTDTDVEPGVLYVYRVKAVADVFGRLGEASEPVEIRTAEPTLGENSPATGAPAIGGTVQVGETLTADTAGIADGDGLDNVSFTYQWVADDTDVAEATGSSYTLVAADEGKAIKVRVSFTDDEGNTETLTSAATSAVTAAPTQLTAQFLDTPPSHDGQTDFTFELRFSEEFDLSYVTLRDHAFTVAGGSVQNARRLERDSITPNIRWEIKVRPNGDGDVTITLPETTDCSDAGAICTEDSRMLSTRLHFTVSGPRTANSPATGAPFISGTVQVGETLTADTTGIEDADGMDNASFSYQWLADDADIAGATNSTYTPVSDDEGRPIKVRVTFTDDADYDETLTSAATAAVKAGPNSPAMGAPTISGAARMGETLTADVSGISDADGLTNVSFSYQWVVNEASDDATGASYTVVVAEDGSTTWVPNDGTADTDIAGATGPTYALTEADEGRPIRVRVSFTDDRGNSETVIGAPTLMAGIAALPTSHDGESAFTFELRFSEDFDLSYKTLRDHAFTVTGGTVQKARRLEPPGNVRWEITVRPDGDGGVTVVLPVTTDCDAQGAVCTEDGRMLSSRNQSTVRGPG